MATSLPSPSPSPTNIDFPSSPSPYFTSSIPRSVSRLSSYSTATSSPTSQSGRPGFHFPGPSSRYNRREKAAKHTRFASNITTPVGPELSTERRAHRRTQSSANFRAYAPAKFSPSTSENGRSPLSRFASYPIHNMAIRVPKTPNKSPARIRNDSMRLQDSPFSDYFTDDARSTSIPNYTPGGAAYSAPSSEVQHMLVRLHRLQAQLMRAGSNEQEALHIIGRRLDDVEADLNGTNQAYRLSDLEDSGLFMDEEEEYKQDHEARVESREIGLGLGLNGVKDTKRTEHIDEQETAETDYHLVEAQHVLDNLTRANEELRKRRSELAELHDNQAEQLEDRDREIERLRSENEGLKSDLGFDHSELLFLKLQMKAIEVEVEELADNDYRITHVNPDGLRETKRAKRDMIMLEMDRWRDDWHDVEARLRRRTSQYKSPSGGEDRIEEEKTTESEDLRHDESWRLETVKEGRGRVSSITVKRLQAGDETRSTRPTLQDKAFQTYSGPYQLRVNTADQACQADSPPSARPGLASKAFGTYSGPCQLRSNAIKQDSDVESDTDGRPLATSPETASEKAAQYTDRSMQTSITLHPTLQAYGHIIPADEAAEGDCTNEGDEIEDDCAITTSPSTAQNSPAILAQSQPDDSSISLEPTRKSAWAELWEGLGHLAGSRLDD